MREKDKIPTQIFRLMVGIFGLWLAYHTWDLDYVAPGRYRLLLGLLLGYALGGDRLAWWLWRALGRRIPDEEESSAAPQDTPSAQRPAAKQANAHGYQYLSNRFVLGVVLVGLLFLYLRIHQIQGG
ncbi:hypothetical protein ABHF91_13135 [Pseudaeromonas sp. ZJS20]|uniref:hypothetical protein n=1 Tax=Pseudaeromonas aegiceratis TaxID=3153928 RepID=UPI00390CAF1D